MKNWNEIGSNPNIKWNDWCVARCFFFVLTARFIYFLKFIKQN